MSSRKKTKKVDDDEDLYKFDEDNITDSDDQLSDTDKKLLNQVRKRPAPDDFDSEDEVYALNNDDDDDDDDDGDDENDSKDSDIEFQGDDDMPNEKAWGKNKRTYYHTDYVDPDYASSNQKDMAAAEAEEKEAMNLQQRLAEQFDDGDFGFEIIQSVIDKDKDEPDEVVKLDLSSMTKNQKLLLLEKESPEFEPLLTDFKTHLAEIRYIIIPFLNLIKQLDIEDCPALNYIRTRYHLQLNYCVNVSFYLMLKAKKISITTHPVIKRLSEYRQLLNQLDEEQGHLISEISEILEAHQNSQPIYKTANNMQIQNKKTIKRKSVDGKNDGSSKKKQKKAILQVTNDFHVDDKKDDDDSSDDVNSDSDDNEEINKIEDKNKFNFPEVSSDQKRPITYEIAKNKGLTPYRKKELRNPRVKHRLKYRKAQIRRKGAVREVKKELKKYSGEHSGIKASVKKGIKLK